MTTRTWGLVAALLLGSAMHAKAIPTDMLYRECKSTDPEDHINCIMYMNGFYNGMGMYQAYDYNINRVPQSFCPPQNTNMEKVRTLVMQYIEANPALLNMDSSSSFFVALSNLFPCTR